MSDPIADIVLNIIHGAVGSGGYKDADYIDDLTKQIRRQIGQELLERRRKLDEFVKDEFLHVRDIREVCQLEESNE